MMAKMDAINAKINAMDVKIDAVVEGLRTMMVQSATGVGLTKRLQKNGQIAMPKMPIDDGDVLKNVDARLLADSEFRDQFVS